ncbi:hypothetical protein [Nitrosopumilus sp. S4]
MKNLIERFATVHTLKTNLEKEIENTEENIQEYSNLLGEKIRINEESSSDDPDFLALKAKLDGGTVEKKDKSNKTDDVKTDDVKADDVKADDVKADDKKTKEKKTVPKKPDDKKKKGKKGISDKWYNLNEILVYNGMGLKGELELYFKAIDELKSKLENLKRTLATLNNIIEKGLKEDMGCIAFRGSEGTLEIAFLKSSGIRENYSLKSIFSGKAIPVENVIKVGV